MKASRFAAADHFRSMFHDPTKARLVGDGKVTGGFCCFLGFAEDGHAGVAILPDTAGLSAHAESVDGLGVALLRDLAEPSTIRL